MVVVMRVVVVVYPLSQWENHSVNTSHVAVVGTRMSSMSWWISWKERDRQEIRYKRRETGDRRQDRREEIRDKR